MILLATDMDRTVIPNGNQPEPAGARERFRAFCAQPEVILAYVSGRDRGLVRAAIQEWDLPIPDYVIGDVGTSLYRVEDHDWVLDPGWQNLIGADWAGHSGEDIHRLLGDLPGLRLQEPAKQGRYKLSYYAKPDLDTERLLPDIEARLAGRGLAVNLIWSVDETTHTGLLDVLPARADKVQALRYLIQHTGVPESRVVFAGDSGNDLAVFASGIQSVLVANAHPDVRRAVDELVAAHGDEVRVFRAGADGRDDSGNYTGGVLEGVAAWLGWGPSAEAG